MTNTKFRKRALLSSVAMLLVALVALGSATFAWFTADPTAHAEGLHMRAAASTGLVIITDSAISNAGKSKSNDADWTHDDWLNCNTTRTGTKLATDGLLSLQAASCNQVATNNGYKFYTVEAASDHSYEANTAKPVKDITSTVWQENINMKLTGVATGTTKAVKVTGITIEGKSGATGGAAALLPSVRVALIYYNGTSAKYIGEYATDNGSSQHITAVTAPGTTTYADATKASKNFVKANATGMNVALGNCDTTGNCYLKVVAYLDGETEPVKNDNVDLQEVIQKIKVDLETAT